MGKTLVVAEKPSVGRDIANALPGSFDRADTYLESNDYVITWAIGHLVELAEPEDYDKGLKKWRGKDLPIIPENFKLRPRSGDAKKQLKVIRDHAHRDEVTQIINACDAGREGELIFAYTMELVDTDKPVERLWISSMTKKAILDGFEELRTGDTMNDLEESARSRSEADWLVGMNATRAATIRARSAFGGVVSLGRVQTPTLGILAKREKEIKDFEPTTYWEITGSFDADGDGHRTYTSVWFDPEKNKTDKRATWKMDAESAQAVVDKVAGETGSILELKKRKQSERAPLLYDLTSLQRHANQRFGYSARRTLSAAQSLYERHKVLTYPRTASRFLSTDMIPELQGRAAMLAKIPTYNEAAKYVEALDKLPLERVVNDKKVDDHHAIIPTEQIADIGRLRPDEKRIYDLVVRRYLAAFHPNAEFNHTEVVTEVHDERFRTKGKIMTVAGWRGVYGATIDDASSDDEKKEGDSKRLPQLEEGESINCTKADSEEKQTRPPARYSEGTLLSAMETAGKLVEDDELREAMKESGLGTPATRAQIIELLVNRQYIQREGKALRVTSKGMKLIEILDGHPLTSAELTGTWEKQLRDIEHGDMGHDAFMDNIFDFTTKTVSKILEIDREKLRMQRAELGLCPRCGKKSGEIIRENARAYGCTSWKSREETGCGFVIWRTVAGRQLMPEEAQELIENRETAKELAGFKSKSGRAFRAKLRLTDEDKVEFVFKERKGKGASNDEDDDDEQDDSESARETAGATS